MYATTNIHLITATTAILLSATGHCDPQCERWQPVYSESASAGIVEARASSRAPSSVFSFTVERLATQNLPARFSIAGLGDFERESNHVDDIIPGLQISLHGVGQSALVVSRVPLLKGDADGDLDIDSADLFQFRSCASLLTPSRRCLCKFDFDSNAHIDINDRLRLHQDFTGPLFDSHSSAPNTLEARIGPRMRGFSASFNVVNLTQLSVVSSDPGYSSPFAAIAPELSASASLLLTSGAGSSSSTYAIPVLASDSLSTLAFKINQLGLPLHAWVLEKNPFDYKLAINALESGTAGARLWIQGDPLLVALGHFRSGLKIFGTNAKLELGGTPITLSSESNFFVSRDIVLRAKRTSGNTWVQISSGH